MNVSAVTRWRTSGTLAPPRLERPGGRQFRPTQRVGRVSASGTLPETGVMASTFSSGERSARKIAMALSTPGSVSMMMRRGLAALGRLGRFRLPGAVAAPAGLADILQRLWKRQSADVARNCGACSLHSICAHSFCLDSFGPASLLKMLPIETVARRSPLRCGLQIHRISAARKSADDTETCRLRSTRRESI